MDTDAEKRRGSQRFCCSVFLRVLRASAFGFYIRGHPWPSVVENHFRTRPRIAISFFPPPGRLPPPAGGPGASWTAVAERSGDAAFARTQRSEHSTRPARTKAAWR